MKVPEKIYLQVCGDCQDDECGNCRFEDLEDNVTWCKDKIFDKDIEYTRTDAFIEKVCEFLKTNADKHIYFDECNQEWYDTEELIKDFKDYIKG